MTELDELWQLYFRGEIADLREALAAMPPTTKVAAVVERTLLEAIVAAYEPHPVGPSVAARLQNALSWSMIDPVLNTVTRLHIVEELIGEGEFGAARDELAIADAMMADWLSERGGVVDSTDSAVILGSLQLGWICCGERDDIARAMPVATQLAAALGDEQTFMGLCFGPHSLAASWAAAAVRAGTGEPTSLVPFVTMAELAVPYRAHLAEIGAQNAEAREDAATATRLRVLEQAVWPATQRVSA